MQRAPGAQLSKTCAPLPCHDRGMNTEAPDPASHLETRLRRVLRYIQDNPAGDLSLDRLAEEAALSRFHWHRVFHAMTGETCAQAVRRIRAHRAAVWLVETDLPIDRIAARAGYENPRSFARAFREVFGQTPNAFRAAGLPAAAHPKKPMRGERPMTRKVTIDSRAPLRLAGLTHTGPYPEIGRAYSEASAIFSARKLWPQVRGMAAVYFDDPTDTPEAELRSFAGFEVGDAFDIPDDLDEHRQPGGRHAQMMVEGPYTQLPDAYQELYGAWLAQSGETPTDAPSFEVYLNDPSNTPPAELKTLICLPLRA